MSNNQNQQPQAQKAANRTVSATRKPGVPSRQEMYKIMKARSLQLQSGEAKR